MSLSVLIDALVAAGCTPEQLAVAVRTHEAEQEAKRAKKREGDAARQRAKRERDNAKKSQPEPVTNVTRDIPLQTVMECDATPLEVSPEVSPKDNISNPLPNPLPNPPKPARGAVLQAEREEFAAKLWKIIPKRRGDSFDPFKSAVVKAIKAGADPKDMADGAVAYAKSEQGRDRNYRKGAAVWINAKGWTADWSEDPHPPPDRRPGQPGGFASLLFKSMAEQNDRNDSERRDIQDVPLLSVRDEAGRDDSGGDDGGVFGHRAQLLIRGSLRSM